MEKEVQKCTIEELLSLLKDCKSCAEVRQKSQDICRVIACSVCPVTPNSFMKCSLKAKVNIDTIIEKGCFNCSNGRDCAVSAMTECDVCEQWRTDGP